jgi:PadR family transcriptional regulator PadR
MSNVQPRLSRRVRAHRRSCFPRLSDQAYGVIVRQEIEVRTGREVSIGAIYATLGRLETKRYVNSYLGDPTPERGGRSKRFFHVTAKEVAAVNRVPSGA